VDTKEERSQGGTPYKDSKYFLPEMGIGVKGSLDRRGKRPDSFQKLWGGKTSSAAGSGFPKSLDDLTTKKICNLGKGSEDTLESYP